MPIFPRPFFTRRLPFLLIALGVILRLNHYLENRAFWLDEAWLALDISERSVWQLFTAHDYGKPVPIGFALIGKGMIAFLGNHEYSLRLFPLVCGIASLFLFYALLKRTARRQVLLMALGLFVILDPLIYYSAELKYFSSDVAVALLLTWLTLKAKEKPTSLWLWLWALCGALSLWISHTSTFVLPGIVLYFAGFYIRTRQRIPIKIISVFGMWVFSFTINYALSFDYVARCLNWQDMWEPSFWPMPPWSAESLVWLKNAWLDIFRNPLDLILPVLGLGLFLLGCFKVIKNRRGIFLLYIFPIALAFLASALHKYPFSGRVILFAVPALLFFLAEGLDFFLTKNRFTLTLGLVFFGLVLFGPIQKTIYSSSHSRGVEDIRPLMRFLKLHAKAGDNLFINDSGQYAYKYYGKHYYKLKGLPPIKGLIVDSLEKDPLDRKGSSAPAVYVYLLPRPGQKMGELVRWENKNGRMPDLPVHPRSWIFFCHYNPQMQERLLGILDKNGRKVLDSSALGALAYLYEFTGEEYEKD